MYIDPAELSPGRMYQMINALVAPRPIAWVSSISPDGILNLAPHSYFNVVSPNPPIIGFSTSGFKDTARNIQATREFVVNVATEALREPMNLCGTEFPPEVNEFEVAGLTPIPSRIVRPPQVGESPISMECKHYATLQVGDTPSFWIMGRIVAIRIDDAVWAGDRIDLERVRPIGRLAGSMYCRTTDSFRMDRIAYADWLARQEGEHGREPGGNGQGKSGG